MNKKLIAKTLQAGSRKSANSQSHRRSRNFWVGPSVLLAALAISKSCSFAGEPNLLDNGDFELPAVQCLWVPVPEGSGFVTGWNVNIPSIDNGNGGCNSLPNYSHSVDLLFNPDGSHAHSGNQSIDMTGSFGAPGDSIYQDVPTKAGRTYTLTFYTSSNGSAKENGLTVEWDDVPVATMSTPDLGQWSTNTLTVLASSGLSRLRFVNNIGGMQGSLLDNVSLVGASDNEPPIVSCPPSVTVPSGSVPPAATNVAEFTAQGGSISDNQDPNPSVVSSDEVTNSCPVLVTRTYTVTDAAGNATQCQQLIAVGNRVDEIRWRPPLARVDRLDGACEFVFKRGCTIPVKIRALGCDGSNLTRNDNIIGTLEVLALSDCQDASTAYAVPIDHHGIGGPNGLMVKSDGFLRYNLNTKILPADTHCYLLKATITDISTGESLSETLPIRSR
jgi:hypothetical protein